MKFIYHASKHFSHHARSGWYPVSVNPVRPGWYECMHKGKIILRYHYWTGSNWMAFNLADRSIIGDYFPLNVVKWRGLRTRAKLQPKLPSLLNRSWYPGTIKPSNAGWYEVADDCKARSKYKLTGNRRYFDGKVWRAGWLNEQVSIFGQHPSHHWRHLATPASTTSIN